MQQKTIDVWAALRLALFNVILMSLISIFIYSFVYTALDELNISPRVSAFLMLMSALFILFSVTIGSILIYRANSRYMIDLENDAFTFPASDLENSILQIIIFAPLWNLYRRKTVALTSIQNIYLDTLPNTKKYNGKPRYRINITGDFGSARLDFLSRQKRNEVRSALSLAVKKASGRKIDRKIAEFS